MGRHPSLACGAPNIVVYHLRDNGVVVPDVPAGFLPLVSKTFTAIGKGAQSAARKFQQDYRDSVLAVIEDRRQQASDGR